MIHSKRHLASSLLKRRKFLSNLNKKSQDINKNKKEDDVYDGTGDESVYSDDDEDSLYEAHRKEIENAALFELELAKSKPVCFGVKTNMAFDANINGLDSPFLEKTVSFAAKDYLHIKTKFDNNWWIGRLVRIGAPIGFIPSPAKLEFIRGNMMQPLDLNTLNLNGLTPQTPGPEVERVGLLPNKDTDGFEDGTQEDNDVNPATTPGIAGAKKNVSIHPSALVGVPGAVGAAKRKNIFRKADLPPYEIVPIMRPVVLIGPALKGYEVTDLIQKAIFDFLKKHFENRVHVSRVSYDVSIAKRLTSLMNLDKKGTLDRNRNRQISALMEIQHEVERIFDICSRLQLVILDCDTVNHPSQMTKTGLAPIVVYLKIGSLRVLQRLIKTRGKFQKKNAGVQTAAAEKLLQCFPESFDLIIDQNTLESASEALKTYLESYWQATHPQVQAPAHASKVEKILSGIGMGVGLQPHFVPQHPPGGAIFGPDGEVLQNATPMNPGRPGQMSVMAFATHAGFTPAEIINLAGARGGWTASTMATHDTSNDLLGLTPNSAGLDIEDGAVTGTNSLKPMMAHRPGAPQIKTLGPGGTTSSPEARMKAIAAVNRMKAHTMNDQERQIKLTNAPGIHHVSNPHADPNEAPQIYQSRSWRQMKERMEEEEKARRETEALYGKKRRPRRLRTDEMSNLELDI